MVVVQKKKTMPDNKKIKEEKTPYGDFYAKGVKEGMKEVMKEVSLPELALKVNMKKMGAKAADTGMKGAKAASARTRLINMAKQNKKFKDDKSFQKARDKELKEYREAVAKGIKEGMSEKASMIDKIKEINRAKRSNTGAPFKMKLGNKPSIAKFMRINEKTK